MPEYLAPGVYVEETSFRSRPIEGVSTSTTAFVGATRKGPIDETPELVTSLGDFERIYGGTQGLSFTPDTQIPNYVAHAVRAYFDNGGSRLYVSRVFFPVDASPDSGKAASSYLLGSAGVANSARFIARSPGSVGNGRLDLLELATPVTLNTMKAAPIGSLVRLGGANPPAPAIAVGGFGPFQVADGNVLRLQVRNDVGAEVMANITFTSEAVEATSQADLDAFAAAATIDARTLVVDIDGRIQTLVLSESLDEQGIVNELNTKLRGGYARLDAGKLVIGSDQRGTASYVKVSAKASFGFTSDVSKSGVTDLDNLRVEDINTLLAASTLATFVRAEVSPTTGRLQLVTKTVGAQTRIQILNPGASSAHTALGLALALADEHKGRAGTSIEYYTKRADGWHASDNTVLNDANVVPEEGVDLLTLNVVSVDADGKSRNYEGMGYGLGHPRFIGDVLALVPSRRADQLDNLYAIELRGDVNAFTLREALVGAGQGIDSDGDGIDESRRATILLDGGNDGRVPGSLAFEKGLKQLLRLDDISIVAAPGSSALTEWPAIRQRLLIHVERRRAYEIAVIDTAPDLEPSGARTERSDIDSTRLAIYYPWVVSPNPDARPGDASVPAELKLPPSGFLCGIYARNDVQRGVHKTPANEVVRGALRFERMVSFGEQEVLNPAGINCLRSFPGRGHRVWGGRTSTSDQEWKYVSVRRYFNYVEASVDRGTQWAVFEPNGEALWANIRESISEFLYSEWRNGALLGGTPKEAYFVRCDRSTMTQSDLDNGRLICEVGIAVLKPAEFVIFRIGQKTADARS